MLGAVADIDDDPAEPEDAEMVLREFPESVTAESCRQVAITLLRTMANQGHTTLLLTGAMPGAGTTNRRWQYGLRHRERWALGMYYRCQL